MRLARVTTNSPFVGERCKACPRLIESGQSIAYRRNTLDEALAHEHYFILHVRCMERLVKRAQPDHDVVAYKQERQRIINSGDLWQSASS